MAALGQHLVLRLEDGRVLLRDARERRIFARAVHRIGDAFGLLSAGAADNHAHATVVCDRARAGEFARRIECSLRWRLDLPASFAPARIREIEDQYHLQNSFFYDLRQAERHGIAPDPFHEASSIPDLLGLRVLDVGIRERVATYLPRVQTSLLRERLPLPHDDRPPVVECLADAAAAAFGLADLHGHRRGKTVRRAVVAAIHAAGDEPTRRVARELDCSRRFVMKARREGADGSERKAVMGQWRLRSAQILAASTQRSPVFWSSARALA